MTNGNMATISPVSEEDMSKVREVFDNALNALVNMSSLRADVDALRTQVGDLTNQVNRYRSQIDTLDDALYRTRQDRDAANNRAIEAEGAKAKAENELATAHQAVDDLQAKLSSANDKIERLRRESDEHLSSSLEWEDKFNTVNKKLNEIKAHFSDTFYQEPKPTPTLVDPQTSPPSVAPFPSIPQTTDVPEQRDSGDENKPADDPWSSAQKAQGQGW